MPVLHLESLSRGTNKADIIRLVVDVGGINRRQIGKIDLHGTTSLVEVPEGWDGRLAKSLDGVKLGHRRVRAWSGGSFGATGGEEDHFQRLARLLEMESEAEAEEAAERIQRLSPEDAERTGEALINLVIEEQFSGLGGRFVVSLAKRNRSLSLPWSQLGVGVPVLLSPETKSEGSGYRGVVCDRRKRVIQVALNELPYAEDEDHSWRLDHSSDEVARKRQLVALERARAARGDRHAELRKILLGTVAPTFRTASGPDDYVPLDTDLDDSQKDAVRLARSSNDLALIHGPPGTGKTRTVVEVIRQAIRSGEKVLACAPSNTAVDNMLERLLRHNERAVRLGHPARILPALRERSLDILVEKHENVRLARKFVREALELRRRAGKAHRAGAGGAYEMRREARDLIEDARRIEAQTVEGVLDSADVLCSTATGLDSEVLGQRQFDLAVIDETCQSTEPECWIPILRCKRVVLAGDHCQLPPTVLSRAAKNEGFDISLFERLAEAHGPAITRRLSVQYRMHEAIMLFSSEEFYDGGLEAHSSVRSHLLCDLPGVESNELTRHPVTFIDTAGAGYDEEIEPGGKSRWNPEEAELVCRKVTELLDAGLAPQAIAVIAPYSAQVRHLRQKLNLPGLEIDSVDGFQGREKEAVVMSLVRSNSSGEIGFLSDVRRMNVAMTRARRKLLVIGDSATISSAPFYQRLLDYFDLVDAYRTVWEEMG